MKRIAGIARWAPVIVLAVTDTAFALAASRGVEPGGRLVGLVTHIHDAGLVGVLLFALVYIISTVAFLPASVLTLAAGFVYGPLLGTLIVSPVSVVAATCAFVLGRTLARDRIARRISRHPRFTAVDEAVARQGFRIIALLRLSPLFPFNVLNYALGLTRVRLRDYVLASWLGMLPGTVLYVYLGSLLTSVNDVLTSSAHRTTPAAASWLYWLGLGATIAVVIVVARIARQSLADALDATAHQSATSTRNDQ